MLVSETTFILKGGPLENGPSEHFKNSKRFSPLLSEVNSLRGSCIRIGSGDPSVIVVAVGHREKDDSESLSLARFV